jgi:hypothetical protein
MELERMENAIYGVMFLCLGLFSLWKWRNGGVTKEELDAGNFFFKNQSPVQVRVSAAYFNFIILLVGVVITCGSVLMLFSAVTGLDWPFHYR